MKNRRQFLTSATFAIGAGHSSGASKSSGRIDCQSHLFSAEFLDYLEKRKTSPYVYRKGSDRFVVVGKWHRRLMANHTDVSAKIATMDKAGIALAALSINDPGPELFGKDSQAIAVTLNDFIADTVRSHPARFFGLATLPFNSRDAMLSEFERAIDKLGMKGILLYSNLDGKFPGRARVPAAVCGSGEARTFRSCCTPPIRRPTKRRKATIWPRVSA